jgi:3-hydroxybutyryl-CoA dehydrogenase
LELKDISKVAVVGAGTMGAGMGMCFARAGYRVVLQDIEPRQLDGALKRIDSSHQVLVREGAITREEADRGRAGITVSQSLEEALEGAQFVLEAVPENLELKHRMFGRFEELCPKRTILASNTSGLSITSIASVCDNPERVAGMHWVNPPELVPLVEVISGQQTSEETADLVYGLGLKIGKMPVRIRRDVPGFGLNRLQFAVLREALHLVGNGIVSPRDVDRVMRFGLGFRYPWLGPLETADLGGLDVFHSVASYLFNDLSDAKTPPDSFTDLIEQGKLGIKTGEGFYRYETGSRDKVLENRDRSFIRLWKLMQEMGEITGQG